MRHQRIFEYKVKESIFLLGKDCLIHSLNNYLLTFSYLPDIILSTGDRVDNIFAMI